MGEDPSLWPSTLELRSSAGAGEYQGCALGLYHLTTDPESERQGPAVYRQLHDGQIQYYLYRWEI